VTLQAPSGGAIVIVGAGKAVLRDPSMTSRVAMLTGFLVLVVAARAGAAPANDACTDATAVVAGTRLAETVDTSTATTAPDDPLQSCTVGGPGQNTESIWYRFAAPSAGILSVYTYSDGLPDDPSTIVSVYTGACGALAEVACDDHDNVLGSYLHTDVSAATDHWIEVARAPGAVGAIRVVVYFDPDSPICPHDAGDFALEKTNLTLGSPPGHGTRVTLGARPGLRAAVPDVATTGVQLLVETADGYDYAPIVEWSAQTLAVPPGGPGSGCAPKDGWVVSANGASFRYRNDSNALPPACVAGSANGLTDVRVKRRPNDPHGADLKVKARGSVFATALAGIESVRLSVTFDPTIGASNHDRCAASFFPLLCKASGSGTKLVCR
jgi:hypothetical protein